jgi:hypothetical protein
MKSLLLLLALLALSPLSSLPQAALAGGKAYRYSFDAPLAGSLCHAQAQKIAANFGFSLRVNVTPGGYYSASMLAPNGDVGGQAYRTESVCHIYVE